MPLATNNYRALTQAVSADLGSLRTSTPDVMKAFGDLGRAATADGALDKVAIYMGGGPSLMYAASAIRAFDEFAGTAKS